MSRFCVKVMGVEVTPKADRPLAEKTKGKFMPRVSLEALLSSGAHFGHLTRRWDPKMKPYIFMERNGIHIIDLRQTQQLIDEACEVVANLAAEGKKILCVGTKKQARDIIRQQAQRAGLYYATERWLGGMLTNFSTIRKSVRRLQHIEKMETDNTVENMTKKEGLFLKREKEKLEKTLSGVRDMNKLPGAVFVVDIKKEHIAVAEASRLGIPIFAMVDTNCDPDPITYVIPSNDDAVTAIELVLKALTDAYIEGSQRANELKVEAMMEQSARTADASKKVDDSTRREESGK
jgi:small subunit ribosomal protein S2